MPPLSCFAPSPRGRATPAAWRRQIHGVRWGGLLRGRSTHRPTCESETPPARAARGFTLVELMVAIVIMALLALVSWRGIDGMVRSHDITRARADELVVLQTVMAQWSADLDALQAIEHTDPIAWDGQVLRLTRRGTRAPDEGALVVAWALRAGPQGPQWLRWQSQPVRTRAEWQQAWQQAALWARTPGDAERRGETPLMAVAEWQLFYFRGGAWANALSSGAAASAPRTVGGPGEAATRIPEGVRLQLRLPAGGALAGTLTRDWVNPLLGGGKS